jgi:hypothetical protein
MKRSRSVVVRRAAFLLLLVACGSRTGLFVDDTPGPLPDDDGGGIADGSFKDGGRDGQRDTGEDTLPLIDAKPPVDAPVKTDCPDAAEPLVYLITSSYQLLSFYPPDATFKSIGNIACPTPPGNSTPFSMAVDRKGVAFIVFNDGNLYRVSTATAACIGTSFQVGQSGFQTFGMGYATINLGPKEELFIAGDGQNGSSTGLGKVDTTFFAVNVIGSFVPQILRAELTGTGTGQLYAFYTKQDIPGSFIGQIDKTNAHVVAETPLPTVEQNTGWAFAFYGGDFYTFTGASAGANSSVVTRYRPGDGSTTKVGSYPTLIVGAGVSTCAPEQ